LRLSAPEAEKSAFPPFPSISLYVRYYDDIIDNILINIVIDFLWLTLISVAKVGYRVGN
jgi:hypothetical protein